MKKLILPFFIIFTANIFAQGIPSGFILKSDTMNAKSKISILVSVLRYNGKIIDIAPLKRGDIDDFQFGWGDNYGVSHVFNRKDISDNDALVLMSKHGWSIDGKFNLYKLLSTNSDEEQPSFLIRKTEKLVLED